MENSSCKPSEGDALQLCNKQYQKIKNAKKKVDLMAKNVEYRAEKVALLANGTSKQINMELQDLKLCDNDDEKCRNGGDNPQTLAGMIQKKLDNIVSQSEVTCKNVRIKTWRGKPNITTCGGGSNRLHLTDETGKHFPSLPTTSKIIDDTTSSYSGGSEYVPDDEDDVTSDDDMFDDDTSSSFYEEMQKLHPTDDVMFTRHQCGFSEEQLTEAEIKFINESDEQSLVDGCKKSRYYIDNQMEGGESDEPDDFEDEISISKLHINCDVTKDIPSTSFAKDVNLTERSKRVGMRAKKLKLRDEVRIGQLHNSIQGEHGDSCEKNMLLTHDGRRGARSAMMKKSKSLENNAFDNNAITRIKSTESEILFS